MQKTKVICGFPGIGKSYAYKELTKRYGKGICSDSDSSMFDKRSFPSNYIKHIQSLLEAGDNAYIFVSSHEEVREALKEAGISYMLVYPDKELKYEYLDRYKSRGSSDKFIELLGNNFDSWISQIESLRGSHIEKVKLSRGETLLDVLSRDAFDQYIGIRKALFMTIDSYKAKSK